MPQSKLVHAKLFFPGRIVATPGALEALDVAEPIAEEPAGSLSLSMRLLARHLSGDWGDLDDFDKKQNDDAIKLNNRIFSAYALSAGVKIWVITEADRSVTTFLLPEEY